MNIEDIRLFCLDKSGVTESFPFDDTTLVLKVEGKMFILINLGKNKSINIKCNPDKAIELREHHHSVLPGYHMSKKHWNTITLDNSIADNLIREWIDNSYELVVAGLPKNKREKIALSLKR